MDVLRAEVRRAALAFVEELGGTPERFNSKSEWVDACQEFAMVHLSPMSERMRDLVRKAINSDNTLIVMRTWYWTVRFVLFIAFDIVCQRSR